MYLYNYYYNPLQSQQSLLFNNIEISVHSYSIYHVTSTGNTDCYTK